MWEFPPLLYLLCFIYQSPAWWSLNTTEWHTRSVSCRTAHKHKKFATTSVTEWSASCIAECFGSVSCQTKLWGVRACSPDVSQGVHPLNLIRLIRGSNLLGWHRTLLFMSLISENSQDGWMLHSPEQLRTACSSRTLTWEPLGRVGFWLWCTVSVLNQNCGLKEIRSHWAFSAVSIFLYCFFM